MALTVDEIRERVLAAYEPQARANAYTLGVLSLGYGWDPRVVVGTIRSWLMV